MSKNIYIGFWEVLLVCIAAIVIVGMCTGYDVDVGKEGSGCIAAHHKE